ncbi:hypothetical protein KO481_16980 [Nocardia sp. NEAU-G5]|uniref:Uncharacterized protein n=1 Tax=Nocardia albiluteola TaxID=2842303 RepID=A0ABS6AYT7_9NOCA|nr:hypothetical protein [Nocardia albiluteola]MBU3063216.1 hypothetical protein [Nocardia albiluteola]
MHEHTYIQAGADIDTIISQGDEAELMAVWTTYHRIQLDRAALAGIRDNDAPVREDSPYTGAEMRQLFGDRLAEVAAVSPAQALAANHRLVELLTGRRWWVMRDAREAGDSWAEVGAVLGRTAAAALDWYSDKIARQERYVGSHDGDRARAVLDD